MGFGLNQFHSQCILLCVGVRDLHAPPASVYIKQISGDFPYDVMVSRDPICPILPSDAFKTPLTAKNAPEEDNMNVNPYSTFHYMISASQLILMDLVTMA